MVNFDEWKGKRICVAVSGGVDSTALLHYLRARATEYGFSLSAVHCEHGIRGEESVADMRFVEALCENMGVPLFVFREDCPKRAKREKCSLETAARNFRKEKFAWLIQEDKADMIATAHHQNDEAETVLFRIARGASLAGARGMAARENTIVRPFLDWTRAEIVAYAKENAIVYREDKTNFEEDATRNKLRLRVLPALEEAVAGACGNLVRFARLAGEDDALLYRLSQTLLSSENGRWLVAFSEEKPLFTRACLTAIKALGLERDYTAAHLESAFALQYAERGAYLTLPQNIRAEKTLGGICLYLATDEEEFVETPPEKNFDEKGFDGGRYAVSILSCPPKASSPHWAILRVDGDKIPKDAVFRFRKEGDEIKPFGGGTKSLKKFFNEKKIPVKERAFLPLIASKDSGAVYAVCGVEIADILKTSQATKNTLYIILRKK